MMKRYMQKHASRFWSKVKKTPTCWLWTGGRARHPKGKGLTYGVFGIGSRFDKSRRNIQAHRFSWELTYGHIPDGKYVLHRCDVPQCVRPDHLFIGSQRDNMDDMMSKGRGYFQGGDADYVPMTKAESKRKERARKAKAGYVRHEFWIKPKFIERVKRYISELQT